MLPVLYAWYEEKKQLKLHKKGIVTIALLVLSLSIQAQQKSITVDQAIALAIENNKGLKATSLKVDKTKALISSAFSFDKTSVYYNYDESNLAINNRPLKVWGVQQDFKFPTVYFANKKVNKAQYGVTKSTYEIQLQQLKKEVHTAYYHLIYVKNKATTYQFLDSLYQNFSRAAKRRFELGETNYLEMITAQSKEKQLQTMYKQVQQEVTIAYAQLKKIVQVDTLAIQNVPLLKLTLSSIDLKNNKGLQYFESSKQFYKAKYQQEKQQLLPDLSVEYFRGSNSTLGENITGYQLGIKIPLLFSGNKSRIKASKIAKQVLEEEQHDYKAKLKAEYNSLLAKLQQYEDAINYYNAQGKSLSNEIIKTAESSFKNGEIDFFQYIQSIENATDIELIYLDNLNQYNKTIIAINFLII